MKITRVDPIVAITCSDIHLSLKPPIARAEEPNWLAAMVRPWLEIGNLIKNHDAIVLCGGDVFDKWNSPPELINWALEYLPTMYAIPGNHDLPNHRPELAHRSAYGTLVRAGKIKDLGGWPVFHRNLAIYGRPEGEEVPLLHTRRKDVQHVLLTHEYLWTAGAGYHGAPEECKLSKVAKKFYDFDVVVVGDNHIGFERKLKSGTHLINNGTLLRRKANEAFYQPRVGLIHASGKVTTHELDISQDIITREVTEEQERADEEDKEVSSFVEELTRLETTDLNFREIIVRTMAARKVSRDVQEAVLEAMGG